MKHNFSEKDTRYMRRALSLAERVKGRTSPNPAVGAIIVKNDRVVGEGSTEKYGGKHAEKRAIAQAKEHCRGATLYVTLEPCHHFGKTPPCTTSIFNAGLSRVVVATKDSNPLVNGKGIAFLRRKGISVQTGLLKREAQKLNDDFFWSVANKTPWITLKLAMTLDGRIADKQGMSKWITGIQSRTFVHDLRRRHDALAIGHGTLKADNPYLTVRHVKGVSPIRIVFASSPSCGKKSHFRSSANSIRSIIVCQGGRSPTIDVAPDGVEIWHTGKKRTTQHLHSFLNMAYANGIMSILFEGGQKLASSLLEEKLVNRLYIFYGNSIIGQGVEGLYFSQGLAIKNSIALADLETAQFGNDYMITGLPHWK